MARFSGLTRGLGTDHSHRISVKQLPSSVVNLASRNANVLDFGAVSDARQVTDASIVSGSALLSSAQAAFTTGADKGRWVMIQGAALNVGGTGPQNQPLVAQISSVSGGVATLDRTATATATAATATIGTGNLTAFQNAYNTGLRVVVPGTGTGFLVEGLISGPTALRLWGDGVGRSIIYYCGASWLFIVLGPTPDAAVALTADSNLGDHTLALNTAGLSINDYLLLSASDVWTAAEGGNTRGEVVRVRSVDSAAQVTVYGSTFDTYTLVNSAQVNRMSYLSGHSVEGIEFRNGAPESTDGGLTYGAGNAGLLSWQYCSRINVKDVRVLGSPGASFFFTHCLYFDVENVAFDDGAIAGPGAPNAFGYGVYAIGATQYGQIRGCKGRRGHHSIFTSGGRVLAGGIGGGIPRFIDVVDCNAADADVPPYHTHFSGEYIDFIDCRASRSPFLPSSNTFYRGQFFINGKNCRVVNARVDGAFGAGICVSGGDNNVVEGGFVRNVRPSAYGIIKAGGGAGSPSAVEVAGATNTKVRHVDIDGVTGAAGDGVFVSGGATAATGTEISGVTARNTTRDAVRIEDLTDSTIVDNVLGINNGGYVVETTVVSPVAQWSRVRGINPTLGLTSTPNAIIDAIADDGLPGLVAPSARNFSYGPTTLVAAASTAYLGRVRPSRMMTITKIAFIVSVAATANDNIDLGIYDSAGSRMVSLGSTASQVNGTGLKVITIASTTLLPGRVYYIAFAYGTIGAAAATLIANTAVTASNAVIFGTGVGQIGHSVVATSFPLPSNISVTAPATPVCIAMAARET